MATGWFAVPVSPAMADVSRSFGELQLGARCRGCTFTTMPRTAAGLDGFSTLDLRAEYAIADAWRLQARVANVFDESYETVAFYNSRDGRST